MSMESMPKIERSLNQEQMTELLKKNSMNLFDVSKNLIEGQNAGWAKDIHNIEPFSWNENAGVLVFNDGESTYVTRASSELRNKLNHSGTYTKNESWGVPSINDGVVWKDKLAFEDFKKKWEQIPS